jgi:tetraacyldisaccharide 4'-kinase
VVGIGGATLGGAGKTVVTGALASSLHRSGLCVAVVASGYRARVPRARSVCLRDTADRVGDEALALCRLLAPLGVEVFVGRHREQVLARAAAAGADIILVDGLLQSRPVRLGLSILVLDGAAPWGRGRCPPAGDLRARRGKLRAAADIVLSKADGARDANLGIDGSKASPRLLSWSTRLVGARGASGELLSIEELQRLRLGLILALARPERVEGELRRHGLSPEISRLCADHAIPNAGLRLHFRSKFDGPLDGWLTTPKCATKLGQEFEGAPLLVLEQSVVLPESLVEICRAAVVRRSIRRSEGFTSPMAKQLSSCGVLEPAP